MSKLLRCVGITFVIIYSFFPSAFAKTLLETWQDDIFATQPTTSNPAPALDIPKKLLQIMQNRIVVFAPGIVNELGYWVSGYFKAGIYVVNHQLGSKAVPLYLWSHVAIDKNADYIASQIEEIYKKYGLPILLIGHSKGGVESLLSIFKNPQLLKKDKWGHSIIDKIILIQSAIGGSILTAKENPNAGYHRQVLRWITSLWFGEGLDSLQGEKTKQLVSQEFESFKKLVPDEAEQKALSSRVFYVRTSMTEQEMCWGVYFMSVGCLKKLHIPNLADPSDLLFLPKPKTDGKKLEESDGIVLVSDQFFPYFGTDTGILPRVNHMALTLEGKISQEAYGPSRITTKNRIAFFHALFKYVFEKELTENTESPQSKSPLSLSRIARSKL